MGTRTTWIVALVGRGLCGQDIAGDWQGTLKTVGAERRIVLSIAKQADGGWKAAMLVVDSGRDATPASSVTLQGSDLKLTIDALGDRYEGKVSADGASIEGTWRPQGQPVPLVLKRATKETSWRSDPSPHTVQFINVDKDVRLEVLDWGGSGRPVVLLTGLGNNAHVFDKFAPKLTGTYHVYGITRRGFGASDAPATGYSADRLGDDVLAVIDALKLNRPVLVGHSIGGEELSSVGSRHPETVAGLIYLDAGYSYAYYDRSRGDLNIDLLELQRKLEQLKPGSGLRDPRPLIADLLASLPGFEKDLRERQKDLDAQPSPAASGPQPAASAAAQAKLPGFAAARAIMAGQQKYTEIHVPILAIYALPHDSGQALKDPAARAAAEARDLESTGAQAKAFESGLPSARVVRLSHANHYVFQSNEADVLREMNAFIGSLP
jgi:pimeloyl-ACP methyl ester carboxylesterase